MLEYYLVGPYNSEYYSLICLRDCGIHCLFYVKQKQALTEE